jgi:hypothetical protein
MSRILIVIPIIPETAAKAEKLLDWISELNEKEKHGDVLIVFSSNVHPEQRLKIQITADVTFETVSILNGTMLPEAKLNAMFKAAAEHVLANFKVPFMWLEPECLPLKSSWMAELTEAYVRQPKRHMGAHLFTQGKPDKLHLGRIAIYSSDMAVDSGAFFKPGESFEIQGADTLLSRSSKSRLIQYLNYESKSDFDKIRKDAVLLCSDKTGQLAGQLREINKANQIASQNSNGHSSLDKLSPKPRTKKSAKLLTI